MMLDATKPNVHRDLLERELESVGIRLNKRKPNIYFKQKKGGGLSFNSTCTLTKCNEKMVQMILHSFKIFNAEVLFREDCTTDEFIDVVTANRVYLPCLYVYNKIDQISIEEVDRLARQPHSIVVSCNMKLNLDYLLEALWDALQLIRVYTKKPGAPPDFDDGLILRKVSGHNTIQGKFQIKIVLLSGCQCRVCLSCHSSYFGCPIQICLSLGYFHKVFTTTCWHWSHYGR